MKIFNGRNNRKQDMKLHLAMIFLDPTAFERETLNKLMPEEIVMRRIPQFGHIFQAMGCRLAIYGLM
jgi:hypothetical protein